jgi:hypothetical protein
LYRLQLPTIRVQIPQRHLTFRTAFRIVTAVQKTNVPTIANAGTILVLGRVGTISMITIRIGYSATKIVGGAVTALIVWIIKQNKVWLRCMGPAELEGVI